MGRRVEKVKQSLVYRHADIWTGGAIGATFQGMETRPEVFDYATGDLVDIPAQLFEDEINSWNGDKLIHATAFYSLSRGVMKTVDKALEDPSIYTKAGVSFAAVTAAGGWKELEYDNYPDPMDMAANYAGWALAVSHEYHLQENEALTETSESLEEIGQVLESED